MLQKVYTSTCFKVEHQTIDITFIFKVQSTFNIQFPYWLCKWLQERGKMGFPFSKPKPSKKAISSTKPERQGNTCEINNTVEPPVSNCHLKINAKPWWFLACTLVYINPLQSCYCNLIHNRYMMLYHSIPFS